MSTWCGLMTPLSLLLPHHEHSILAQNDSLMLEWNWRLAVLHPCSLAAASAVCGGVCFASYAAIHGRVALC